MKNVSAIAAAAVVCAALSCTAPALTTLPDGSVPLFSAGETKVYGQYDPLKNSTALFAAEGEAIRPLGTIADSNGAYNDFTLAGNYAYACYSDPGGSGSIRLMRVDLKDGLVAKAAEFQNANPRIFTEPADGKVLLYGLANNDPLLVHYSSGIALYDPTSGALKTVISLESLTSDRLTVDAATYDQGWIYALVARSKNGALTFSLRKYTIDGKLQTEQALSAAMAAPGGDRAATMGVSGDYVRVNNAFFSTLFRISDETMLYQGECLRSIQTEKGSVYIDGAGNRYQLDMARGTFSKIADGPKGSDMVEACGSMIQFLSRSCNLPGESILAVDTTSIPFANGEKATFFEKLETQFPTQRIMDTTMEELRGMGYLGDNAFAAFQGGALITLSNVKISGNTASFDANVFRSVMGTDCFTGAKMEKKDNAWAVASPGERKAS